MKKIIFFLLFTGLVISNVSGQKSKDALYLKNGSIIYGDLSEITDGQYRITTSDRSLFIFDSSEIDKFVKESPGFSGRKEKGGGFSLEGGLLIGPQSSNYVAPFSFNLILQMTSKTNNIFGLGTGVEYYGKSFTPLFVEYKNILSDKKTSPFIFVRGGGIFYLGGEEVTNNYYYGGYSQPTNQYKGGVSCTLGTGISWAHEESETYLSFAFRYAHFSRIETTYNSYEYTYKTNLNRLEIKYGWKF